MILTLCEINLGWLEYEEIFADNYFQTLLHLQNRQALMLASNEKKV